MPTIVASPKPRAVIEKYTLIYRCLNCTDDWWYIRWSTDRPQERELTLECDTCQAETRHRIAGLGPISRLKDCPDWCTDHKAVTFPNGAVQQHRHFIAYDPYMHLGRWKCFTIDITQYEDHPWVRRADEKVPAIHALFSSADVSKSRLMHELVGQAIALIEGDVR